MILNLDHLQKLAEASTNGPWTVSDVNNTCNHFQVDQLVVEAGDNWQANADYIAALSPDVVLELINEIRRLEGNVQEVLANERLLLKGGQSLRAENAKLREALETAVYDLERLRDANWGIQQLKLGAKSGAYLARAALESVGERVK